MNNQDQDINQDNQSINLQEQITKYLYYWKWFALGLVVALALAFLYLRYTTPVYQATSMIMLKDDHRGGASNELSVLSDLGLGSTKDNVENEMEVLKSRTLSEKTVQKLKLNISYYTEGRIRTTELYKNSPIRVEFAEIIEPIAFELELINDINFKLRFDDNTLGTFTYGEPITHEELSSSFVVDRVEGKEMEPNARIVVSANTISAVARGYRANLQVSQPAKFVSVVNLTTTNTHKQKAEDYLNTLVNLYNQDNIEDRRFISQKTSDFITQRLDVLIEELGDIETEAEKFKIDNRVTDIMSEARLYVENASDIEKSLLEIDTKISIIETIITEFINKDTKGQTFPMIVDGLGSSSSLATAIARHNELVLYRNGLMISAGPENQEIKKFDEQSEAFKNDIKLGLLQYKSN